MIGEIDTHQADIARSRYMNHIRLKPAQSVANAQQMPAQQRVERQVFINRNRSRRAAQFEHRRRTLGAVLSNIPNTHTQKRHACTARKAV